MTNLTLSPIQFIHAVGSDGHNTIMAGATDQTLSSGSVADTLVGYAGGYDTFRNSVAGLDGDTIGKFLSTDWFDITNLNPDGATLTAPRARRIPLLRLFPGLPKRASS